MGFPLRRMIEEVGGGVLGGKKLKCVIPGGSSCPVLKADEIDVPMDFDALMDAADLLPKAERELLYGLVQFWFKVNARNFVEYYRNRRPKT